MQFHFGGWRLESGCGHVKALFIVEHYAEIVLPIVDRAIVLVNGKSCDAAAGVLERALTCRSACSELFIAKM